ncbi:MAG TPA: hypothetical protein VKU80_19240 [Planctomycetota bacterium]|nr:hypothetical protein [Planctomycetota bacterium]
MTTEKSTDGALPGKEPQNASGDRIPASVLRLMQTTPRKEWSKIKAFFIESEEEGELFEMLPEVNRVMKVCPPKLVGRVRKHQITGDQLDQGYQLLHDAIHGVRQALYALLILAGFKDPEKKESKSEEAAPADRAPAEILTSAVRAAPPAADRFAQAGGSRKL